MTYDESEPSFEIDRLRNEIDRLRNEVERLTRERDAAIARAEAAERERDAERVARMDAVVSLAAKVTVAERDRDAALAAHVALATLREAAQRAIDLRAACFTSGGLVPLTVRSDEADAVDRLAAALAATADLATAGQRVLGEAEERGRVLGAAALALWAEEHATTPPPSHSVALSVEQTRLFRVLGAVWTQAIEHAAATL
jgi:chromosome segregation ATPase